MAMMTAFRDVVLQMEIHNPSVVIPPEEQQCCVPADDRFLRSPSEVKARLWQILSISQGFRFSRGTHARVEAPIP
jgi:hypothetical protein